MPDKEILNPQHIDSQKPGPDQKTATQPNQPVQQKSPVPVDQPKTPQSQPEKHDEEKKHA